MRLYKAKSRTLLGSSSGKVNPKSMPPRPGSKFSRKWTGFPQRKFAVAGGGGGFQSSDSSSAQQASKITSAFFDPFELDDATAFSTDPFAKKSPVSSATTATEKLTPGVSSESRDLLVASSAGGGFITFPEHPAARIIDFQAPAESDVFNDTNTWMSSSTLSTKFTNREMNVAKTTGLSQASRVFTSPPVFRQENKLSLDGVWHQFRPDEVFVSTSHRRVESTAGALPEWSTAVAIEPDRHGLKAGWNEQDEFDPFGESLARAPPAVREHETCATSASPPKENNYAAVRANLRKVSRASYRQPLATISNENAAAPRSSGSVREKNSSLSQQHSRFAMFTNEKRANVSGKEHLPPFVGSTRVQGPSSQQMSVSRPKLVNDRAPVLSDHLSQAPFVGSSSSPTVKLKHVTKKTSKGDNKFSSLSEFVLTATATNTEELPSSSQAHNQQRSAAQPPGARAALLAMIEKKIEASPKEVLSVVNESSSAGQVKQLAQGTALQDLLSKQVGPRCDDNSPEQREGEDPPLKDDPAFSKYFKMLKMGLPTEAVKNAMQRDEIDPSILDLDHSKSLNIQTGRANQKPGEVLDWKDDPKYAKYAKMLKLGLPAASVTNAMQRDGVDPMIVNAYDRSARVNWKEDPKYAKYANMLKLGLPAPAVKNAMQRDGIDSAFMDDDCSGLSSRGGTTANAEAVKAPKDKFRRTRVHWETHSTVRSNTVWAMVKRDPNVVTLDVDEEEFARLFQTDSKPVPLPAAPAGTTEQGAHQVVDKKRANNGGITLARIKLSYDEIAAVVNSYDESALSQEQIRGLLQYLPTAEEKKALRNYLAKERSTKLDELCECEKFMVAIMDVKHAKRRLNTMLFIQKFSSGLEELRRDARLVQKACDEIMGSSRFRKVLGVILNLGNRLNTAGPVEKQPAAAITLESFSKLNQPKAFDKKTTFLQYVVSVLRKTDSSLCHFHDDLAAVFAAERLQWDQTLAELSRTETQLESVRRLALYHGLEKNRSPISSRGSVGGDSATAISIPTVTVEQEIDLLKKTSIGNFTLDACARLAAVVDEIESAKTSGNALLLYFGEEEKTALQPNDVFQAICSFSRDFESAVKAVVENEKAQAREARRLSQRHALVAAAESDGESVESAESFQVNTAARMSEVINQVREKPDLKLRWRRRKHI